MILKVVTDATQNSVRFEEYKDRIRPRPQHNRGGQVCSE